tara:strand:+ start:4135 stop:4647 length:513 start_codon:yes stop_codon:yes gene_type:complete
MLLVMTDKELLAMCNDRLTLNEDTGGLTWSRSFGRAKGGSIAGSVSFYGYLTIRMDRKLYQAGRLVFLMVHGYLPPEVDHMDNNPLNNKPSNLRAATRSENMRNTRSSKNSTSKYLGVHFDRNLGKWRSRIYIKDKSVHLGCFSDEIDAARSYDVAAVDSFGEFANLNFK